ncbi:hypothetical protein ACSXEJ_16950 (plasmid) [Clostridium perfringens]|uniref:Uncharacterized protein n=1 Tax=Clostridium perfringens E str. JGS1987 TaxID=451755 RepID=B1BUD2_CLOPF|nr:hypothetical protein [Clostridium perfringens]EDT14759.1 hypothetical protein AC3_1395 [Clostridium perfringens E str. JGS1987]EJT6557621.1 hypothetical protein [Clostridium perfringens]
MTKVINLANYKKERESLLDEEEVIYDIGDLDIKKTGNGKLLIWIEGHIYFESLEDLKATYIDFRDSVCNDFNITNNNKLDEVDFKLKYSKKSEFYNVNVDDFYINDCENLVEKLNYIIANIKKDNVEIQE